MGEILKIYGTYDTPDIELDPDKGTFTISGRSMPSNALKFYEPVREAIVEYGKNPQPVSVFNFKMDFISSSSTKIISEMFYELEQLHQKGHEVKVMWYYRYGDDDLKELGDDMRQDISFSFEFVAFE